MTKLFLVRHGQTDWNVATRYQGHSDIPLNETGLQQAATAVQNFSGTPYEAIYASDLQRAQQTAHYFAEDSGLPIESDVRLREIFLGEWEGKSIAQIRDDYPDLVALRRAEPTRYAAPDGETVLEVARRVVEAADEISAAHPDGNVLIVAHGMSMATLYCLSQQMDLNLVFTQIFDNAEIRPVEWYPGKVKLED
jgi:broad specificity phosphatase PhoE